MLSAVVSRSIPQRALAAHALYSDTGRPTLGSDGLYADGCKFGATLRHRMQYFAATVVSKKDATYSGVVYST